MSMQNSHTIQQQRFELKYVIPERVALAMRDFLRCHLIADEHTMNRASLSYPVHSVYLDSIDLKTHQSAVNGTKNRFKLRLRYYNDHPDNPIFFEIKARVDNCIRKQRCGVHRRAVGRVLKGHIPEANDLLLDECKNLEALQNFIALAQKIGASPRLHNRYSREAWVCPEGNSLRVTFDRNILAEPHFRSQASIGMQQPVHVLSDGVVLELKFTARFPGWLREMVEHFNLVQSSFAKYSNAVDLIGESYLRSNGHPFC